jgi:polar amino acid transport system permease protein
MAFDLGYAVQALPVLLRALETTVLATVLGMAFALASGLSLALLQATPPLRRAARFSVLFVRDTPLLVQLYFLFFGLPALGLKLGPLATGVLGLGLHYGAYASETYRAGIEAVGREQWEAARSLGFSRYDTWTRIVLPQAVPPMLPAFGNQLIAMLKDTPLLSAITVVELVQAAQIEGARSFRYLELFTLVGLLFWLVSSAAAWVVALAGGRLVRP